MKNSIGYIANFLWQQSLQNIYSALSENEAKQFSNNDYYHLTTIYYMSEPTFTNIAAALNVTKPAVSVLVNKLEGIGLVTRVQSETDKRKFYVILTEKGINIIQGDEKSYEVLEALLKNKLGNQDAYNAFEQLLDDVVDAIKDGEY